MLIANILLGFTAIIVAILSVFILYSGPRKKLNLITFSFLMSLFLWITTNLLTNISSDPVVSLWFGRSTLVGAAFIPITFLLFVWTYLDERHSLGEVLAWLFLPVVILMSTPTDLNIKSIEAYGLNTVVGPVYVLVLIEFMIYFATGLRLLSKKRKKVETPAKQKLQINYIYIGALLTLVPALLTNAVLPVLGYDSAVFFGPSTTVFLAIATGAAIFKYDFLDIRLVAARLFGYVLSIITLSVLYGFLAFNVINLLIFSGKEIDAGQRIAYTLLAVIIGFTLQPLKRFFDKVTNRLFYQDAYSSQEVLDVVSGIIVGNVDLHKVQKGALKALSDAMKPTYMVFLLSGHDDKLREGELIGQQWHMHDPSGLHNSLGLLGKDITIHEELGEGRKKIREVLRIEDISVVAPLVTKDETIGYLILGPKKSGNIYNSQDVGLLNIASNELAVALQNAQRFEEIQAFNITLQEKVTEATRELKRTNRKLVALDEAKDEFISMASHQLRTPLTSIKGYISMMLEGDLGKVNPQQEQALKEAFGSSQRMVYLIADFLNVSRIKTGKFVIEPKEVDLPQVVGEEITQLREMAASRDIGLQYEAPVAFPRVKLDDNKIRQVMMNMVDNAIYYTQAGGTVTIQLYVDGSDVVFKVIDTGIGVPKHEQHKLFTKFFRAGNARKARPDGTGLGLFMAQKIIVEQGGSIIFESKEGEGSTFGFRFPLAIIKA